MAVKDFSTSVPVKQGLVMPRKLGDRISQCLARISQSEIQPVPATRKPTQQPKQETK